MGWGRRTVPVLAAALLLGLWTGQGVATDDLVTFTGGVEQRDLASIDVNAPVLLTPGAGAVIEVDVVNTSNRTVEVRSVRLDAKVIGLVFFTYTTRVDLVLEPGARGQRRFALDIADLGGQATGLLPAELTLLGPDREVLSVRSVPVDVQGQVWSVYGVFALSIALITALLTVGLLVRLAAHRLPANRFSRAWRFAVPGIGLGLACTFTLSALRLLLPSSGASLSVVITCALVAFAVGFLSPVQDDGGGRYDLDEADLASPTATPARPAVLP